MLDWTITSRSDDITGISWGFTIRNGELTIQWIPGWVIKHGWEIHIRTKYGGFHSLGKSSNYIAGIFQPATFDHRASRLILVLWFLWCLMWIWGSHRQIAHMLRRGACRRRLRCRSCQSRHRGMAPRRSTCAPGRRRPHGKKPLVNPVPRNIKIARVNDIHLIHPPTNCVGIDPQPYAGAPRTVKEVTIWIGCFSHWNHQAVRLVKQLALKKSMGVGRYQGPFEEPKLDIIRPYIGPV